MKKDPSSVFSSCLWGRADENKLRLGHAVLVRARNIRAARDQPAQHRNIREYFPSMTHRVVDSLGISPMYLTEEKSEGPNGTIYLLFLKQTPTGLALQHWAPSIICLPESHSQQGLPFLSGFPCLCSEHQLERS